MIFYIGMSTFIAFCGIILLTFSAIYNSTIIDYCASILLAPSILLVFGINIFTWKKGQPDPLTFNKMVKEGLDEFFKKINNYYETKTHQGTKWSTIDGHFWVEVHLDQSKKIDNEELDTDEFYKQSVANMDYILSLANVSSRGRQMLIRDLNKMEETALSGEDTEQEGGSKQPDFDFEGGKDDDKNEGSKEM
jgi:hypothetical protein